MNSSEMIKQFPILDFAKISGKYKDILGGGVKKFESFYPEFCDVMRNIGFAYLVNHEVDLEYAHDMMAKSREFFELPSDIKQKYDKPNLAENYHGYSIGPKIDVNGVMVEPAEAFDYWGRDAFDESKYPVEVPELKRSVDNFRNSFDDVVKKILRCLALGLNLEDPEFFIKDHQSALGDSSVQSCTNIRNNSYPALDPKLKIPTDKDYWRLSEHTDIGTVSLVIQDSVGGLEAKMPDGEWVSVTPIPGSIVLNMGNTMELWSGGHFPATPHRVRLMNSTSAKRRESCGFFLQPDGHVHCTSAVLPKENWEPSYPFLPNETALEYIPRRVYEAYKHLPHIQKPTILTKS